MDAEILEKLRYPIGKFKEPSDYTPQFISECIADLEELPKLFRIEMKNFTNEMLEETYRPSGWTARQVIHHVADSHINAYIRFKLTLTEEHPVIKPYKETLWAELSDTKFVPVEVSLLLLENLHSRLVSLIRSMSEDQFNRSYFHPGNDRDYSLKTALALYAWHGKHHLEHIRTIKRKFELSEKK